MDQLFLKYISDSQPIFVGFTANYIVELSM